MQAWLLILAGLASVNTTIPDETVSPTIVSARKHEQRGQWQQAAQLYQQALIESGGDPQHRAAWRICLRRGEQERRLADPCYRRFTDSLSLHRALVLYGEVLEQLQSLYWNRDAVSPAVLFQHGLDELVFGRNEPDLHLLVTIAQSPTIRDVRDAQESLRKLALAAKYQSFGSVGLLIVECAAGACSGLDEYTLLLHPGRDDELKALGLSLSVQGHQLLVDHLRLGSWAERVGLQVGDSVRRRFQRGHIELEVNRPGHASRFFVLPEAPRAIETTEMLHTMARPDRREIGYIRIAHFGRSLSEELNSSLLQLHAAGANSLVIDLRGNGGGSLMAAVQATKRFLDKGVIVTARGQHTGNRVYSANRSFCCSLPLVLLVDGGTASAAEVFVGALKENQRAIVVGQTTFGKATVQQLVTLDSGGTLQLSIARLHGPSGRPFHDAGITPEVVEIRADRQLEIALKQAAGLMEEDADRFTEQSPQQTQAVKDTDVPH